MKSISLKISILAFVLFVSSCAEKAPEKKEDNTAAAPKIETFNLQQEQLSSTYTTPAELQSFQQVDLYAKISAFVRQLKVDIGSHVKKGDLLLVLEAPESTSQLGVTASRLHAQEAVYLASNSTYKRLLETSKTEGTVSSNDLEQAEARKNADYAQLQAAKSAYAEAQNLLDYLQIRAPFDGIITARNVNTGAYVGPAGKGSDLPLFTVQQQEKLRLAVSMPELYTGYIKNGDQVSFSVKSLPGQVFKATVTRMSGALDTKLRSERIEMDIQNKDKKLLPGMIAQVSLSLEGKSTNFVVPGSAVFTSSEGSFVLKVEQGKTKRIPIEKGRSVDDKVEIFGPVQLNDVLVKNASEEIKDGTEVK